MDELQKPKMMRPDVSPGQLRLLWLVYIMGGILLVLFLLVLVMIAWQVAHLT